MSRNYLNSDDFRRDAQRDAMADDARNREARMTTALIHFPEFHAPHDVTLAAADRSDLTLIADLLDKAMSAGERLEKRSPEYARFVDLLVSVNADLMAEAEFHAERLYDAITEHEASL